jgi:hypothetical protein
MHDGPVYTPQDPPYPTLTVPDSTMTGTWRLPPVSLSISSSLAWSFFTSWYVALSPKADLAWSV